MVLVRRSRDADWPRSREVRLAGLLDAPLAFASTYEQEVAFSDGVWLRRIAESAQFLAETDDGTVIGTATGFTDPDDPTTVLLVAGWAPTGAAQHGDPVGGAY